MKIDEQANVRTDTGVKILALFFVSLMFLAYTTDPIATGTKEGDRAPVLEGMVYNGNGWAPFDMAEYLSPDWTPGDTTKPWLLIDFMDTDCPYCIRSADDMFQFSEYFMQRQMDDDGTPAWKGPKVNFVASATQLDISGHESSRAEIIGFRDLSGGESCGGSLCSDRDGGQHRFPYIDDLDQDNMKEWKIPGTPAYFLIQPDGIVAWSSSEHRDETVSDAIFRLTLG